MAYVRVVRFTDVSPERVEQLRERINERGGPPEGVESTGVTFISDASQGTVVVLQHFESEEKMRAGAEILSAMDAGDTPGTRASVDAGEVVAELTA